MKNKDKAPLSQRICLALDIAPEALPHTPTVTIAGRSLVKICGGGGILLYSPEEIRVALRHGEYISVKGFALCCSSYNAGAVGIEGRICSVGFSDSEAQNER